MQGHGWTETWAACKWAVDEERQRKRKKEKGGRERFTFGEDWEEGVL